LTYTLVNGSTADASQVMQNYNDLLNGITDGSKDLSISALTCAGTATLNGNVALGNSAADTLTVTASLASGLVPDSTGVRSLGSSAIGFLDLYLAASTDADTARIIAAAHSADRAYTVPDSGADASFVMTAGTQTIGGAKTFSSPVIGPAGAVGAPAFCPSDSDTGLYSSGTNELAIATNGVERFTISATGGATFRNETTSGAFTQVIFRDGAGSSCGTITMDTTANTVAYNTSSDRRLKTGFAPLTGALELVKAVAPQTYERFANPGTLERGFVAQDMMAVVPEAVTATDDGKGPACPDVPWSIDYGKLTTVLWGALRELAAKVEALSPTT
jgi:hypothetical protein